MGCCLVSRDIHTMVSVLGTHVNVANIPKADALAGQALLAISDPLRVHALDHWCFRSSYCW